MYYHCDVNGMFGDRAVEEHSKRFLRDILAGIDEDFNDILRDGRTGMAFLVTRPLVLEVALQDDRTCFKSNNNI